MNKESIHKKHFFIYFSMQKLFAIKLSMLLKAKSRDSVI